MGQPKGSQSYTGDFHASNCRSAWLASEKAGTTKDIYGRNFRAWSEKLDRVGWSLRTYLESCALPLTTFARIWSVSVTQSGFSILKLRLSERGTGARGCSSSRTPKETQKSDGQTTLWRTPKADDANHGPASETGIMRRLMKHQTIRLQDQVNHPGLFRTPDAGCARGAQSKERFAESLEKGRLLTLNDQVAHMFPTPRAADGDKGLRSPDGVMRELSRGHGIDLPAHVQIFPTPTIHGNYNRKGASAGSGDGLETFVKLYPTPTCNDSKNNNPPSQRTESGRHSDQLPVPAWGNVVAGGSLNPSWVEWLMGFPIGWTADIGT